MEHQEEMRPPDTLGPEDDTGQEPLKAESPTEFGTLESWHANYIAIDGDNMNFDCPAIQALQSDILDYAEIERQAHLLVSTTHTDTIGGFCGKCRHLLDHWPALKWEADYDPDGQAVGRPIVTSEVQAAAMTGCKFCSFLLTRLSLDGTLDIVRKIEARLRRLNDNGTASLSIQNFWGMPYHLQFLWLNFPGKVATHVNSRGAVCCKFESRFLFPNGKL